MSVVHLIFVKAFSFGSNVTYPKKSRHVPHWKKLPKARSYFHAVFGLASCHCLSNFIILFAESQQNEIHLSLPPPTSLLSTSFGTPFNFCSLEGDVIEPAAQIWKQKKKKLKASKARVRIWCGFELKGLPICMYINSEYMPPKVYINIYIYIWCVYVDIDTYPFHWRSRDSKSKRANYQEIQVDSKASPVLAMILTQQTIIWHNKTLAMK